jgi:hypothetical protein
MCLQATLPGVEVFKQYIIGLIARALSIKMLKKVFKGPAL